MTTATALQAINRGCHLAIAAMALAAVTGCGGASASKSEVPQAWPPAPPAAAVEAPTTSPAASAVSETTGPWSDGMSDTAPNRFVEKNGIRFAYRAFGRKPGVPLLLLAPLRGTMDSWDPLLTDELARGRPVILFDNAGVGLSSGDAPATVAGMAKDAATFVDALRELHFTDPDWVSGHVDLLGLSLGGFVAQQLALDRPDVVARVVLAGTAPRGGEARAGSRQRDRDGSVTDKTILAQLAAMKAWGAAPGTGPRSYLPGIKQPVLVADGEASAKDVAAFLRRP